MERVCPSCLKSFSPHRSVANQKYCGAPACQRARKNAWRKTALEHDPDHRANQLLSQRRWRDKNPGYWQEYRARHPEYVHRNRLGQAERNHRRGQSPPGKSSSPAATMIAKRDELNPGQERPLGHFRLVPIRPGMIAKRDELIVRLEPVFGGSG